VTIFVASCQSGVQSQKLGTQLHPLHQRRTATGGRAHESEQIDFMRDVIEQGYTHHQSAIALVSAMQAGEN